MLKFVIVVGVAALVAVAGGSGGMLVYGVPLLALCAVLAFLVQWVAFVPAYLLQTEKFYDLTGSLTFMLLTLVALYYIPRVDARSLLLASLILIWAARLGSFLFARILRDGADGRFARIKPDPLQFLFTWTLQGLWVFLTSACALAAITGGKPAPLAFTDVFGAALWACGFVTEAVADYQKRRFRREHGTGMFIRTGLWRFSRHPNYLGEIMLWGGVALLALPALQGWALATLVSPVFVYLLLTRISGIPLLERAAERRWGDLPDYQQYRDATPLLLPFPGRRGS
ncbi:DUF1295 domain-containing protein [Halieaceae bacterium]|nr:DUF1295 domain-containing protein [Halieaceae bacterium]